MNPIQEKIYKIVASIPRGKVITYGLVALKAGGGGPRYVGWCMHHNPDHNKIPCHRVVSAGGKLAKTFAFGGIDGQAVYLRAEGIDIKRGKIVDFKNHLWDGK